MLIHKIESKTDTQNLLESEVEEILPNGQIHRTEDDDEEEEPASEHSYKQHHRQTNGDHRPQEEYPHNNQTYDDGIVDDEYEDDVGHEDNSNEMKGQHNGQKQPAFDFNSIRLMHEYMQQHLSKLNGLQGHHAAGASDEEGGAAGDAGGSGSDSGDDDEEHLPLIPEIELITPSDEGGAGTNGVLANDGTTTGDATVGMTQMRGYQCPHCFQIFEMRQVLKAHMQSVHGTAGPVYECTNCKKTYFYKRFLEKHIRRGRCVKKRRNQT